ncbi:MAG: hypothetical protein M1840_008044 [Geoglossum simile]|nr:MAG: hypothetical protein M1840_008044 [Geoglossum simile]
MDHTGHKSYSQTADRSTFRYPKHGQVRILPKPRATTGIPGNATSTTGVATALFGNTTAGGYYRYNPGNRDESASVNNSDAECILPESHSVQTPTTRTPQAVEGRQPEAFANGQPQILKRAVQIDAERPQRPGMTSEARPTPWTQAREPKGYRGAQRGRARGGRRGRGRGSRAANGSSRSHQGSPNWRLSLCVNTPTGKQQAQWEEGSGWSVSGAPLDPWAVGPEDYDFIPSHQGFQKIVDWLDASDENEVERVSRNEVDNESSLETYGESYALSTLSLKSRPTTPETCLNTGGPTTAARRRQVQRMIRGQTEPQILDAGTVKSMEMVYEEAKHKMIFIKGGYGW